MPVGRVSPDAIQDDEDIRLHIPMDLSIKLGQRKKNLGDPKPGPVIPAEEVRARIFTGG